MLNGRLLAPLRRPLPVAALLLVALVLGAMAVLLHRHARGRLDLGQETRLLDPAAMHRENGLAWTVDLGTAWMSSEHRPTPARLLEDGKELGPATPAHEVIRREGGGRFSFWGKNLYFSTSDGSDPSRSGRRYEVVWPRPVPAPMQYGIDLAAIAFAVLGFLAAIRLWGAGPHRCLLRVTPRLQRGIDWFSRQGQAGQWRICVAIAVVAVLMRSAAVWAVFADPVGHISGSIIMTVPFSDAMMWDALGESVMRGDGLAGAWSARRPFYAFFVGGIYALTGPFPWCVVAVQVLLSSITAALICRIGQHTVSPAAGLVAGLAFALDPISIEYSYFVQTETLGTFLFVLSVWQLITGVQNGRAGTIWWSGLNFALSNLTRTLTLLAAPLMALSALWFGWRRAANWRRGVLLAVVFALGVSLPIGVWVARQKCVYDLTTISDNTASGLYAAASPKYRVWDSAVDREADEAHVPGDIKSRYDWFMRRFGEELAAHPGFYAENALRSATDAANTFGDVAPAVRWLVLAILVFAWSARLPRVAADLWRTALWCLVLVGCVFGATMLSRHGVLAVSALGCALAAWRREQRLSLVLLFGFVATVVAASLFALAGDPRLLMMVSWLVPMWLAHGALSLVRGAARLLGERSGESTLTLASTEPWRGPAWWRWSARVATVVLVVLTSLLAVRNYVAPMAPEAPFRSPSLAEAKAAVEWVERARPGTVDAVELADPTLWYQNPDSLADKERYHGRLVVAHLRLDRHRYPLLGGVEVAHYSRMFVPRTYDHMLAYAPLSRLPESGVGPGAVIFTAPLPPASLADVLVVGRANVDRRYHYEENYLEVIAWAPFDAVGPDDLTQLQLTSVPAHEELVRKLRR